MMIDETKVDDRKWGWQAVGMDHAEGPFDTLGDALANARAETSHGTAVRVGRVEYPDAAKYCKVDIDDLLEHAEELANDDDWWSDDDAIFAVSGSPTTAQDELNDALATWAARWVKARVWTLRDAGEVTT